MKWNFVILTFLLLTPLHAFGDFVPGRVRATAQAELTSVQGNVRTKAVQLMTDGKGHTAFTLAMQGREPRVFRITRTQPNRCGQTFLAESTENGRRATLQLDETTPAKCRQPGKASWRATVNTERGRVQLVGYPEYFLLSQ